MEPVVGTEVPHKILERLSAGARAEVVAFEARLDRARAGQVDAILVRDTEIIRKSFRGLLKRGLSPHEAISHAMTEAGYPLKSRLK